MEAEVLVVGGGPAGLMAAAAAAEAGARVLLLEKGERLGRKLIISGGGRCNVTNNRSVPELVAQIPGNGKFMYGALTRFGPTQIIAFFEGLGVALKEEDHGRMFPVTDKASTVAETLVRHLEDLGVRFFMNTAVGGLLLEDGALRGLRLASGKELRARAVVLAVGGMSVPRTGSTGDGYAWARAAGHRITPLFPTEVPILSDEPWIAERSLMGLSLREAALSLHDGRGKRITTQQGDCLVAHFGLTGPAALRLGHYVSVARLQDPEVALSLRLDARPELSQEELEAELKALAASQPRKGIAKALKGCLPERLLALLLQRAGLDPERPAGETPHAPLRALAALAKGLPARVTGTKSIEEAFVTGGGVHTKEVDPVTMGSRLLPGLFFAGELLDVHAHTGGYNISIAFSSGHAAGQGAANFIRS